MEKPKLLVISPEYFSFIKDQVETLAQLQGRIIVLVRYNPSAEISRLFPFGSLEKFQKGRLINYYGIPDNVTVTPTPILYGPWNSHQRKLGDWHFKIVSNIIQKKSISFDFIHAHFLWSSGYVAAKLKEKYDVPLVVTAHGYDIYSLPFKDAIWRETIENILNAADAIITVSQSNLVCIKKLDVSTPVTVIPNGFRSDLFYPRDSYECRKTLSLPQNKKIILTVGNLEPIKGQAYLIEAIRKISRERKDVLCVIVGSGKLHTSLQRQIRSLELEGDILLVGGKPHDEIPLWMNACDIFVLPSLKESFGIVQIEAMACGKPVIATRNGGSEEVITSDEYGLLVEPANIENLAKSILLALDHKWDMEAILRHAERFTWETLVDEITEIYNHVLK